MKSKLITWIYPLIVMGMVIIFAGNCKKDETEDNRTYKVGENYGGGVVFYVDDTGKHGLIAALNDVTGTGSIAWGCQGTNIPGTGTAKGTGQANTAAIVNGCATAGIAARLCDQLNLNGFDDWYLPSKDELDLIYDNLKVTGKSDFSNFLYWSSSQVDASNVWTQNFWDDSPFFEAGGQYVVGKTGDIPVRAIRKF
jgi:hypothetical protein